MHFNRPVKKFKSITYGYSNQVTIFSNENFDVISIFALRNQQCSNTPISVTLIYRSPNLPHSFLLIAYDICSAEMLIFFLGILQMNWRK